MIYLGDFAEDAVVYFPFTTNAADGGRESLSASLEEADIVIFKNNTAMTLDASTITITANPSSMVGVYTVTVNMANDADFTTGAEYSAVLYASDETVDSQNIAAVLATWSCQRASGTVATYARIGAPAGASISADIATVDTVVDGIQTDLSNGTDGLGAIKTAVDAIPTSNPTAAAIADAVWDELQSGHVTGGSFGEIATEIASILADTNELQTDWANGGRLDLIIDGILADTAEIGTAGAGLTNLGGMSTAMKAEVNAEMVDVIATDTYAEPGQGAPAATASLAAKINYLYKNWRNKRTQTATTESLYDDAGTTVDQKRTVSDDGTTATKGEIGTGP